MSTTSVGDEGLKARQMRNRVLGLWLPMGLLCVLGIGLLKSNTELALWAMAASALWGMAASVAPVSYTHLTLPTSDLV